MANMSEKEIKELEANRKALGMLVGDVTDNESDMEFTGDAKDPRFATKINENKEFALDPTHKHFHKMEKSSFVKNKK